MTDPRLRDIWDLPEAPFSNGSGMQLVFRNVCSVERSQDATCPQKSRGVWGTEDKTVSLPNAWHPWGRGPDGARASSGIWPSGWGCGWPEPPRSIAIQTPPLLPNGSSGAHVLLFDPNSYWASTLPQSCLLCRAVWGTERLARGERKQRQKDRVPVLRELTLFSGVVTGTVAPPHTPPQCS